MHLTRQDINATHPLERFVAILAAAACVVITTGIWASVSAYQGMWPLPALYLIEMAALSIVAASAFIRGGPLPGGPTVHLI